MPKTNWNMKHIIFLPLLCLLSFVDANAAAQTVAHTNVIVGETREIMPPGSLLMTGFSIESGSQFVTVSSAGEKLKIKGLKVGEAKVRLQYPKGKTQTMIIHVKQRSFANMPQPTEKPQVGNPGTLVEPEDIDKPDKPASRWKENYVFNPPVKNFLFWWMFFDDEGNVKSEHAIARIDDYFIEQDIIRKSKVNDIPSTIWSLHTHNYQSRLSTNGGMGDDLKFHMFYADGFEIIPENEEEGRRDFYDFAPRFSDKRSIITMDIVKKRGRAEETDDDTYEKMNFYPDFMDDLRKYGFKQSYLNKFYRGMENICGVNCWVFDFRRLKDNGFAEGCWWVDPATGIPMQHVSCDGSYWSTMIYELNYTAWDSFGDPRLLP